MSKSVSPTHNLPGPGPFRTIPNAITLVRTTASMALAITALLVDDRVPWLIAGYLTYWIGDSLDGLAARVLDQETRAGAVFDICSDRLNSSLLAAGLVVQAPDLAVPVAIYLFNFMVVDMLLSLSFLLWPLVSPNYFGQVDPTLFRYNWSHPAKAINNAGIIVAVVLGNLPVALLIVVAQISVKIASCVRLARILARSAGGDASARIGDAEESPCDPDQADGLHGERGR